MRRWPLRASLRRLSASVPGAPSTRPISVRPLTKPRNEVRETPRIYHDHVVAEHQSRTRCSTPARCCCTISRRMSPRLSSWSSHWAVHGIVLVCRDHVASPLACLTSWLRGLLFPHVATSLTVDKLHHAEIDEMLMTEQRALVGKTVDAKEWTREGATSPRVLSRRCASRPCQRTFP